ncbi:MAG TPA: bifunctional riboflavin kinase/FMN adenylyltransferase [Candidatus Limnocylindria bacterium]
MRTAPQAIGLDELPHIGPAVVSLGVFDGVHRGHAALLDATRQAAGERGAASVALVFDPPPDEVLRPGSRVPRLAPLPTVLRRIVGDHGLDHALPLRFDDELRQHPAETFIEELAPAIELRGLVMSPESAFGRGRGGTVERMRQLGSGVGFEVITVDPVVVDGAPVSSTRIRAAIADGDVAAAMAMGYPPRLEGTVVPGDRRGRQLGFPTANLAFDYLPAMPPLGIYVGLVAVPERNVGPGHPALVSVGVRPTFHDEGVVLVEAYLLDYDGDLYGAQLALDLLTRLRDERRFADVDALVHQMRRDEAEARALLGIG